MISVVVLLGEKINRWEFENLYKDELNLSSIDDRRDNSSMAVPGAA